MQKARRLFPYIPYTFGLWTPKHRPRVPARRSPVVGLLETLGAGFLQRQRLGAVFARALVRLSRLSVAAIAVVVGVQPLVHEPNPLLVVREPGERVPVAGRQTVSEPLVSSRKGPSAPRRRFVVHRGRRAAHAVYRYFAIIIIVLQYIYECILIY